MSPRKVIVAKGRDAGKGASTAPRVRMARPGDVEALVVLLGHLFAQESDFVPAPAKQRRALRRILAQPKVGRVFVLTLGGQVVGMVSLLFTISTAEGGKVAWLEDMVVRPDRRGQGLGTRLLQAALAWARREGITRVTLLTDGDNLGAQQLYARHGFAPSTMRPYRLAVTDRWPRRRDRTSAHSSRAAHPVCSFPHRRN